MESLEVVSGEVDGVWDLCKELKCGFGTKYKNHGLILLLILNYLNFPRLKYKKQDYLLIILLQS